MGGNLFGVYSTEISHAAAGVFAGVAVEHFAPIAAVGHADAVTGAWDGRKVADDQDCVLRILAFAKKRNCAGGVIVGVDPLESGGIVIENVHGGLIAIEAVQL